MRTALVVVAVLSAAGASPAHAQRDQWFGITWQMAQPLQNTHDFTSPYSFRGMGIEWRWVHRSTSFGINAAWNVMNQNVVGTGSFQSADITGKQFRYINAFPIMASLHVYLGPEGGARGFLGANIGTYYIERQVDVGIFQITDNNWHFGLAPELGFAVPMRGGLGNTAFFATARYNYGFAAGDAPYQSWLSVHVGFAYRKL